MECFLCRARICQQRAWVWRRTVFSWYRRIGEFPAALKAVAEWFPKEERALATGIFNSGTNFAALLAPIIIPFIALRFGWRYGFIFTASMSMLWLIVWMLFPYNRLRPAESQIIDPSLMAVEPSEKRSLWSLLSDRGTIAFATSKALTDPVWWFYLFWGPWFLTSHFHITITQMSLPLVVIYFSSSLGSLFGGWLSGYWIKHGRSVNFSRKAAMTVFAVAVVPVIFAARVSNPVDVRRVDFYCRRRSPGIFAATCSPRPPICSAPNPSPPS